ncbi:response regulator [candidate division KSB1 bacterium]|nr:response regulator [candidate division KSB1 bacterium]
MIHILLAEDEDIHSLIIQKAFNALEDQNFTIHFASDGEAVLEFIANDRKPLPDIILMDLKLPKLDGFDLLQEIRQNPRTKCIPVIILTSSARQQDLKRCYELGCNSYIVKPMNFNEFKEIIFYVYKYWTQINLLPTQVR